jgi:integrase
MSNKKDGVFTRKDRDGYWISWTDAQGKRRYRRSHAETLAQARSMRSAELLKAEQSKTLGFCPPGDEKFAEVATRFLQHQKARLSEKAYVRESGIVKDRLQQFYSCRLADIRRSDVQRYLTHRSGSVSAHTVVKELNVLKHLMRLAVEWEIIPFNPAQGMKAPKVPAGRVRYLQPAELKALLESSPKWLQPIVGLAVSTGMRRSEILGLRRLDVDLHGSRVVLPQTKNGDGRIVYLNKLALAALKCVLQTDGKSTDLVFGNVVPEKVSMAFSRACKRVGVEDFRFHDLRHTAASWLRMQGADIHTVAQLLGHKDLRMAARYQHLSPKFLGEAVSRLDGVFGEFRYPGVTATAELPEA